MRTITSILISLALAPILCCPLLGQSAPDESQLPATQVTVKTQVRVSSVLGSPAIVTPIKCGADGSIFLRLAANGAVQDLTGIDPAGNAVVFRASSITDVPNARPASFFVGGDEVFLLLNAIEQPRWERSKARTPDGKVIEQSQSVGQRTQYIARFDRSGKYRGIVKLDIPFRAYQFGALTTGYFVVSGIDHADTGKARVALVTADGRFDRDLILRGDIASDSKQLSAQAKEMQIAPEDVFQFAVGITDFASDGPNVLLVRRNQSLPVFVITPGGLVRPVRIRLPDGFTLSAVIPTGDRWVMRVSKSLGGDRGLQVATFLADPTKGALLEKFLYSTSVGAGLACVRDNEFTFLKRDPDGGLLLLKGFPDPSAQDGNAAMAR